MYSDIILKIHLILQRHFTILTFCVKVMIIHEVFSKHLDDDNDNNDKCFVEVSLLLLLNFS